jgi:hypothetical protein
MVRLHEDRLQVTTVSRAIHRPENATNAKQTTIMMASPVSAATAVPPCWPPWRKINHRLAPAPRMAPTLAPRVPPDIAAAPSKLP